MKYRHLLQELVSKDIKLKYRRSFLGYLWSILNPLLTMIVMVIVFSNMFRFDIENYPVYLIIGQILFSFVTESTTQAIFSITGNAALLKKTYVPKYEFTVAKVTSSLVNLIFSLGAMIIVFLICKVKFSVYFLWIPVVLIAAPVAGGQKLFAHLRVFVQHGDVCAALCGLCCRQRSGQTGCAAAQNQNLLHPLLILSVVNLLYHSRPCLANTGREGVYFPAAST